MTWVCATCGERFTALTRVESHVDTAHGGGRYDCVMELKR